MVGVGTAAALPPKVEMLRGRGGRKEERGFSFRGKQLVAAWTREGREGRFVSRTHVT